MIDKLVIDADAAVADIDDGAVVHVGGFSEPAGCPSLLLAALVRRGARNLTLVSNDVATGAAVAAMLSNATHEQRGGRPPVPPGFHPPGMVVEAGLVTKVITSAASDVRGGRRSCAEELLAEGKLEVEIVGQGTLAERIRCARVGIPAFYSPIGVGTYTAVGKRREIIDGVECVLEPALRADFALIVADQADRFGNLTYRGTARTINPVMAGAAGVTIVEVNEIVALGGLAPEAIETAGPFVDRVVLRPPGMTGRSGLGAGRSGAS